MKLPPVLIYKHPNTEYYHMLDTRTKKLVGTMIAEKTELNNFFIHHLAIAKRRQGYGTKFLDFAKSLRKSQGYDKIRLLATAISLDPKNPPHVFYRKNGFTTDDAKMLKKKRQTY